MLTPFHLGYWNNLDGVVIEISFQVPAAPSSLYIRPCLLGTEATLGLGPSSQVPMPFQCKVTHFPAKALLTVLLSPVCSYYTSSGKVNQTKSFIIQQSYQHQTQPVSLLADPHYVRSFPGGCGDTKMGSNYAPTLRVQQVWDKDRKTK